MAVLPYILLNFEPMTFYQLGMLMLAGLAASGGQFGVTYAYKFAPAKEISVYDYTMVILQPFSASLPLDRSRTVSV